LAAAAHAAEVERGYAQARAAEDSQEWSAAIDGYSKILEISPAYRDAEARRDRCRRRSRVADLESELAKQAAAEDWPRVLATFQELAAYDPAAAAKPSWTEVADRARRELASHPGEPLLQIKRYARVRAVSWQPDSCRVALTTANYVCVYDVLGREPAQHVEIKTGGWTVAVYSVAFSPDGARLATGGNTRWARIWDATSGHQLLEVRHGPPTTVRSVAFSPDGTRLATGSDDKSARIWDATSGQQLLEVRHDKAVNSVAFSPDGTRLATGSDDNSARIWDAASGHKLLETHSGNRVTSVAFSPDGTRLAAGCVDQIARLWDVASGRQLFDARHDGVVKSVAFSPDGLRLATASDDNSARVWDATTGHKLRQVRHEKAVNAVAFSPDGLRLATAGEDNSVKIWAWH
jgi:WD40 repeat protein